MDRYRRLVESSPDGILIVEGERIAFLNAAAMGLFGAADPDSLVGRSLFDLLQTDSHAVVREHVSRRRAGHDAPPVDAKIVRLDGSIREASVVGAPAARESDSELKIVVRDVTEERRSERRLRESEERLALAVAGAQEGVWDWNLETNAVVYSARWKQMLGYGDEEIEPHVSAWERLVHPDDCSRAD